MARGEQPEAHRPGDAVHRQLAGLDYAQANRLLFEVIEYVEPRWKADQAYPPVVGLAVTRAQRGLGNEEAEAALAATSASR